MANLIELAKNIAESQPGQGALGPINPELFQFFLNHPVVPFAILGLLGMAVVGAASVNLIGRERQPRAQEAPKPAVRHGHRHAHVWD